MAIDNSMTEPITAVSIAFLAFQKFIESASGELAKKFTGEAISKIDLLLSKIWAKLRNKPRIEELRKSIAQNQEITTEQVNQIAAYLQVAMDEDPQFGKEVHSLAIEINDGKLVDQSSMTQNNYGQAKGWQTKVEGGTAYIGENHIHRRSD